MALGLFARQAPIGLEVPEWATVFAAVPGEPEDIRELVGGLATMGCQGATVVFPPSVEPRRESPAKALRDWVEGTAGDASGAALIHTRPHFKIAACDLKYFELHREELEAGRALYFLGTRERIEPPEADPLPAPPGGFGGEGGAVVLDMSTSVVGQSCRPHMMLAAAIAAEWEGPKPWMRPNWTGDEEKEIAASASVVMALNWLCKPSKFPNESFNFTIDFIDGITAKCFNERNLRPRWQDRPAAPQPRQGSSAPA